MDVDLKAGIVRILKRDGTTAGTGFVVTEEGLIATCAHVVELAGSGPGDTVRLVFRAGGEERTAKVEAAWWRSPKAEDVAILCVDGAVPCGVSPIPLAHSHDSKGHTFEAFGFPLASPEEGMWGNGEILGEMTIRGVPALQLRSHEVSRGFSGAPVWDHDLRGVVGVATAIAPPDQFGRLAVTAFAIPTEMLIGTCSEALAQVLLVTEMDRLRARRIEDDRKHREVCHRQRVVNLPPLSVTHTFKDRNREIQTLCGFLADNSVRLITVVGRGGMGKTALVSRVLIDLERGVLQIPGKEQDLVVDGIVYLSARSTGLNLERIYADVARMLGEPAASRLALLWADKDTSLNVKIEYLLEAMRDGFYLVLLDNLENHLTREGDITDEGLRLFVECWLTRPGVACLIATSRQEMHHSAAALQAVRTVCLWEGLPTDDAIALLRDLDPQGRLGLCHAPEDDLRQVVLLTRGIPRALELVAGVLNRDPTASLSRLLSNKHLLEEEVVEHLVAEGYRHLGSDERRVMEALAVFGRPVEEIAVTFLLYPWFPKLAVWAALCRLADSHFVSANRATGEYSLHPLDQEHAYGHLCPDEDPQGYSRINLELRAAKFYASIRKPEGEWKTIKDLAPQLAEFEHRVHSCDYDGACRVLEPIDLHVLSLWGHYALLADLRGRLIGKLREFGLRVDNLNRLGQAHWSMGQNLEAIEYHEQALAAAREAGDRRRQGVFLEDLGTAYRDVGQVGRAIRFYEEALAVAREIGDRRLEGDSLSNLGLIHYLLQWRIELAIEYQEEALTIAREADDRWKENVRLCRLGEAYYFLGQIQRAIGFQEDALDIARKIGDRRGENIRLGDLAVAYRAIGQIEYARDLLQQSLVIAQEIGHRRGEGNRLGELGHTYLALGHTERAVQFYEQALVIAQETVDPVSEDIWLGSLGFAYQVLGQFGQAIELHEEGLSIARRIGHHWGQSYQLLGLGRAFLASGDLPRAIQYCIEARELGIPLITYRAVLMLAGALLHQQRPSAWNAFADAATHCQTLLDKTPGLYAPRYTLAAALAGQAVCNPSWSEKKNRIELLAPARATYLRALENCSAPGVVRDACRDLDLIRPAGIEGLEPVFELLGTTQEA